MSTRELDLRWGSVQLRLLPTQPNTWEAKLGSRRLVISMYAPGFFIAVFTTAHSPTIHRRQYQSRGTDDTAQRALNELRGEMRVELEALHDAMGAR